MIRPSDVVMDDANKIDSAGPCATPLEPLSQVNMNPNPMSALSVAPASAISFLPTNFPLPANQGFAVDSDGAAVASRKGTIPKDRNWTGPRPTKTGK